MLVYNAALINLLQACNAGNLSKHQMPAVCFSLIRCSENENTSRHKFMKFYLRGDVKVKLLTKFSLRKNGHECLAAG